uniref:Zasp-like motif domain-containing protein n=1 Tax=Ascaris lumbricoides TaxID=6252 RepID=A0A0M3IM19_ASCLU
MLPVQISRMGSEYGRHFSNINTRGSYLTQSRSSSAPLKGFFPEHHFHKWPTAAPHEYERSSITNSRIKQQLNNITSAKFDAESTRSG